MKNNFGFKLGLIGCLTLAGATLALAQEHPAAPSETPVPVQIVALDECDPATFNAALGPAFCHNVTLELSLPCPTYSQRPPPELPIPTGISNPTP